MTFSFTILADVFKMSFRLLIFFPSFYTVNLTLSAFEFIINFFCAVSTFSIFRVTGLPIPHRRPFFISEKPSPSRPGLSARQTSCLCDEIVEKFKVVSVSWPHPGATNTNYIWEKLIATQVQKHFIIRSCVVNLTERHSSVISRDYENQRITLMTADLLLNTKKKRLVGALIDANCKFRVAHFYSSALRSSTKYSSFEALTAHSSEHR